MAGFRLRLKRTEWKADQPRGLLGADADFIAPEFGNGCLCHGAFLCLAEDLYRCFHMALGRFCFNSPK